MEAVTAIIKNLLKNMRVVLILGVVLGLLLGLIIGWGIWPVQWTNATPEVLREDLQKDYLRMVIDSYNRTGDQNLALQRWNNLGEDSGRAFAALARDLTWAAQSAHDVEVAVAAELGALGAPPPRDSHGVPL